MGEAPPADTEADERAVVVAHQSLIRAFEQGNPEAFAKLLHPGPELLIFHPRLENRFDGIEEVRDQMSRMFASLGNATWTDVHPQVVVNGDVAWLTSQLVLESAQLPHPFVGRSTEIFVRGENGWRLTHGHWSTDPSAP